MSVLFKYYFITFVNTIHASTKLTGVCSNMTDGSLLVCCDNYRVVGNSCVECWPGTYGVDCKAYCPHNFYGRLCLEKCGCEPCDKVTGCSNATDKDQSQTNPATWLTLSALTICFVICFIFCLRIFFLIRRVKAKNPADPAEYGSNNQMVPLENSRYSMSLTSRKIDLSQTKNTETSYDKCQTMDSNNMTEPPSQNAYGHDDSMDGPYNILKLNVSDRGDHKQITNNDSTPLEKLKSTNVYDDTSQMASTVSSIVKTENKESKNAIRREKSKHQKDLFRALDEFKKESTRGRKKLRYSFTKSTELF